MTAKQVRIISLGVVLLFLFFTPFISPQEKTNEEQVLDVMSAKNTLRIRGVSNPTLSSDGKWIVYTKRERDMESEDLKSITHIWKIRIDGTQKRQLTRGAISCSSPSWFPDGKKIAFLSSSKKTGDSDKDSKSQIFFMYVDGGEAWQVTEHEESIRSFRISPDGTKIVFTSTDPLSKEEKEAKKKKDDEEVVDQDFRMTHLWLYDLKKDKETRLTEGEFTVSGPRWSPDSTHIAYETRPNPKVDERWNSDIWVMQVSTHQNSKLYENPGSDSSPRWSPDGKTIAFASDPHQGTNTWYKKLYLIPYKGGEPEILLKDFDLDFSSPIWSKDGSKIYWGTGDRTTYNLFSLDVSSEQVTALDPLKGINYQWELSEDGSIWVWVHSGPDWPAEIYTASLNFKDPVKLSDANPWLREENIKFGKVKVITWKNSEGQSIEGILTYPVDYDPQKRYPLILNPHGGPSSARILSFSSSNQFFAGNGFMVLQPNFRGSSNYGQKFLNANRDYWGIRDYDDCMTGIDYCIDQGWADPERLVCYGWSYGGYMSYWIVTKTDRFKAVSPGAGLPNLYSMYSTTDIPHYLAWFFGTPWNKEESYEKHSPIRYVKNVSTPVLIMHGAEDRRVPQEQAVEFYQALRDLGKEVTFVRYPREGHGISEPRHQLDRLRRYLFFFAEHVGLEPVSEKKEEDTKDKDKK
ncbi:MAG TPA: S9 family peptidase [Acidobacteriota bacterium]|nr:S9 family peptidase [Acidobacteriota bacterium]